MKTDRPYSPFSTDLSSSAKLIEGRVKNILRGEHRRPAIWIMAAMILLIAGSGMIVHCFSGSVENQIREPEEDIFLSYYSQDYGVPVYTQANQPEQAQESDVRLEQVRFLGTADLGDTLGAAYEVTKSMYGQQNDSSGWVTMEPGIEVLTWTHGGAFIEVLGAPNFPTDGLTIEQVIQQVAWGLLDWEVSLWREGYGRPIGIGTDVTQFEGFPDETWGTTVLEDYAAPIYRPGDHYVIQGLGDNLVVNSYYEAADNRYSANHITCLRPDLRTTRGIHVGSSRESVREAYPEIREDPFWDWGEGDYLWYAPWNMPGDLGPAVLFLFQLQGNVSEEVQAIVLVNMVN